MSAYLAVMREGAETIVFFQALRNGADAGKERHAIFAGLALGAIALAVGFVILSRASARIPVRSFMRATSLLLYGLAVVFVGDGIASLQEAQWISVTFVAHVPTITVLGLYPTLQSIGAQLALLALAAGAWFVPKRHADARPINAGVPAPAIASRQVR
jgi:high-affinity iron transporter